MICGLAVPYERPSRPGIGRLPFACEIITRGAFREAVLSGLSKGRPIFACIGHRRNGRKRWKLGSTAGGLRLFDSDDGVRFELDATLPPNVTGVSVCLEPWEWRRESDLLYRIIRGGISHVAILTAPHTPSYLDTFVTQRRP